MINVIGYLVRPTKSLIVLNGRKYVIGYYFLLLSNHFVGQNKAILNKLINISMIIYDKCSTVTINLSVGNLISIIVHHLMDVYFFLF